jgi:hypothetical protein
MKIQKYYKYKAKKTAVNGMTFDSKKEADRYRELLLLEKAGEIVQLKCQVKFVLIPKQKLYGVTLRECAYIADFTYYEKGEFVVEDVKGVKTPEYKIKRKLMAWVHGILIKET